MEFPIHSAAQESLIAFLSNPASYPHRPRQVKRIQTHCSIVFIAAPYAYKIKKPVNFGFLDYSTPQKRKAMLERELELNRRLTNGIYLEVIPIGLHNGRLTLYQGQAVEHVLKMRRMAKAYFMDRLIDRGVVGRTDMDRLVTKLSRFYQGQPVTAGKNWGDHLRKATTDNFRNTEQFVTEILSRTAFDVLQSYTDGFYRDRGSLLETRASGGWIRDCHGDLRLEHIHLRPKSVQIYDCIEFNDRLRIIDVASDLAFLAMDLDFHGRSDLGRYFVERMQGELGDRAAPALMDFYKCYRAYVRGKVECLLCSEPETPEIEREQSRQRGRRYFQLALNYAIAGSTPCVIICMGKIGSGKSTLAKGLQRELGWEILSSDVTRKTLAGLPLTERPDAVTRNRLYAKAMTRKTYDDLLDRALAQASNGSSVIIDATFGNRVNRDRAQSRLEQADVRYRFVEACASESVIRRRLTQRDDRTDEVSDARLSDYETLDRLFEHPEELADQERISVYTETAGEDSLVNLMKSLSPTHPE